MRLHYIILSALSALFLAGCNQQEAPQSKESFNHPSFDTLPTVDTYVIEQSNGTITPNRVYPLVAYKPGELLLLAEQGPVKAGTIWARYSSTGLNERLQALTDKEKEFLERSETFRATELRLEEHTLEEALKNANEALKISRALELASESTKAAIELGTDKIDPPHVIEARINLFEKQIGELKKHGRSREERDALAEFRINREELEALIESHNLKVPFDGIVEFGNSIESGKPMHVAATQNLGTLVDYSAVFLRMELNSSVLTSVEPKDLTIRIADLPSARLAFSHTQIEEVRSTMVPIHYYKISGIDKPKDLIGKSLRVQVCTKPDSLVRIITKTSLLKWGRGDTWSERLASIYPDAAIIHEGNYDLAVR